MILKRLLVGTILAGVLTSPVHAQGLAKMDEPEATKPFTWLSTSVLNLRDSVVAFAERQLGIRYKLGATSPDRGFDCSGLVQYVMAHFNIELPRTSREQALAGKPLSRDIQALRPGDLLTFGHGKRISHIGIYIGDGKYVHAPNARERVRVETLNSSGSWWKGARRILALSDSAARKGAPVN